MPPHLSVIVPFLNERAALPDTLAALRALDNEIELLFVDGGSTDGSCEWLAQNGVAAIGARRGRGAQQAAGALRATAPVLWFLHADCKPSPETPSLILEALKDGSVAGVCSLRFQGEGVSSRFMTWLYPKLSRLGLYYGDAGLFVRRGAYLEAGGFRDWPLFEDLDLISRLRRRHPQGFRRIPAILETSSRRLAGSRFPFVFATWVMLQLLYWAGVSPILIARYYRPVR